jgi:aquaporin Z
VIGAIFGAFLIFVIAHGVPGFSAVKTGFASNGYGRHSPGGYGIFAVAVTEILLTGFLIFVILSTFHGKFPVALAGIAIGLTLTLIHLISIPVDNTSVNPARSIGPALFQAHWALAELWAFILFPLIGGALGAVVYRFMTGEIGGTPPAYPPAPPPASPPAGTS